MAIDVTSNGSSAMASGLQGLQKASDGITRNSANIASQSLERSPSETNTAPKNQLASPQPSTTDSLVDLNTNLTYAQASAKVIETTDAMVGRLIDETA